MAERILFVDDEPAVLDGYKRMLRRMYSVDVANGAAEGLEKINNDGPYAVVISDMRMPVMNGAEFLAQVRLIAPNTVRMLLTGFTDFGDAIAAVNEGNIFRFLTKPCEMSLLSSAITSGIEQYHLVIAETEVIEKTLIGTIKLLTEVMTSAGPAVFGRAMRLSCNINKILNKVPVPHPWKLEVAARLSQIGCVKLDHAILDKALSDEELTEHEIAHFRTHPEAGIVLLKNIPRLEEISWMIQQQYVVTIPEEVANVATLTSQELVLGAKILKAAVAYDDLRLKGVSGRDAVQAIKLRTEEFSEEMLAAIDYLQYESARRQTRKITVDQLTLGMYLEQEVRNRMGVLLVNKGQEVTRPLILKLENFAEMETIDREIMVQIPF